MKLITQIYREFKRDNIMFKNNSEKIFLVLMAIMAIALFFTISGCALLDKIRIPTNVPDVFIVPPDVVNPTSQELVSDENNS